MTLTHGSLFSGVGGVDLGFEAAGIKTKWQCEIDARCRSVLARHWPKAKRYTDVTTFKGDEVAPVDIISFGSPCQDLSVAGKRAGLDGDRSGLFFEAVRIIKEMRDATDNRYPRFAVWENVRGALSSNGGADFLAAIQALADLGAMDIAWRVVNTANFGPPQRRVRVFVVADFGGRCAGEILAQPPRVLWHPPTGEQAGASAAGEAEDGADGGGWAAVGRTCSTVQAGGGERGYRVDAEAAAGGQLVWAAGFCAGNSAGAGSIGYQEEMSPTIRAGASGTNQTPTILQCWTTERDISAAVTNHIGSGVDENHASGGHLVYSNDISPTVTSKWAKGSGGPAGDECQNLVAYTKGTRASATSGQETWDEGRPSPTLTVFDNGGETRATVLAVYEPGSTKTTVTDTNERIAHALTASYKASEDGTGRGTPIVVEESAAVYEPGSMLAENWAESRVKANLRAEASRSSHAVVEESVAVYHYDGLNQKLGSSDEPHRTLRTGTDSGDCVAVEEENTYRVRRLTPRECERLQGWPDDHTRWTDDGTEISDSARYKMAGNGVSAPVAQWLGENIVAARKTRRKKSS